MNHLAKPKISISRLILTVTIIAGVIIYSVSLLTKDKRSTTMGSLMENPMRQSKSAGVQTKPLQDISRQSEDTATAEYLFADNIASGMDTFLVLKNLTAKQIIETVSKYHHIPIYYRGKRLTNQDKSFSGSINLDDDIKNIITMLNRLGMYVTYDGKKIIAGE